MKAVVVDSDVDDARSEDAKKMAGRCINII